MSVLSLGLVLVAILAAVVLLFPVVFRVDFRLTKSGFEANLFVFKKKLWNYTKVWKEEEESVTLEAQVPEPVDEPVESAEGADRVQDTVESIACSYRFAPGRFQNDATALLPEHQTSNTEPQISNPEPKPAEEQPAKTVEPEKPAEPNPEPKAPAKPEPETSAEPEEEEKKSLTEREFWTLALTPDIDERGYRYSKKILNGFVNLFRVRFRDCYVEGIRMDYESMGYGAAVNAMMKGYPFLKDWDLRMDWTHDHDLQSAGHIEAKVNLCRTIGFLTVSSVYGGIFAFVFWRRRAHVLKTGELPELGYVRNKILNWIVEE